MQVPPAATQPGVNLCVHWVDRPNDPDAPAAVDVDVDLNGVPDSVDRALGTRRRVGSEIIELRYRPPQDDADSSPENGDDGRFDVYLDDLGAHHLFGYCASDDPESMSRTAYAAYPRTASSTTTTPRSNTATAHLPSEFLAVTAGTSSTTPRSSPTTGARTRG